MEPKYCWDHEAPPDIAGRSGWDPDPGVLWHFLLSQSAR